MGLLLPLALLRLLWRSRREPAYRRRWSERLGRYPKGLKPARLWVHAVSVGEVQAAFPFIEALLGRHPDLGVLVTTTTPTGYQRVCALLGGRVQHCYLPYDLPALVGRLLHQAQPRLVVILETEIWPSLLATCESAGVPVILANARLSERSARGYARFSGLMGRVLRRFTLIAAQSPSDAQRFLILGAEPERLRVMGSLKFDLVPPPGLGEGAAALRHLWGRHRPVWVAGSTHEGEEVLLLTAHQAIRRTLPDALLVLVPRHPERFARVAGLVRDQGLTLVARSEGRPCGEGTAVFLGDTLGELPLFLAAADAAFIGGSLVPAGGHNLLEATAVGVPVAVGPHTFNVAETTELLVQRGAAQRVRGAEELAERMVVWLSDAGERARIGAVGRQVVSEHRGALQRLLFLAEGYLPRDAEVDAAAGLPRDGSWAQCDQGSPLGSRRQTGGDPQG